MKINTLLSFVVITLFTSCAVVPIKYDVPPTVFLSHEDVMAIDFPTKKAVFNQFGSPTRKESFDDVENWYYKLGEITNSNSIGFMSGTGRIKQDPNNPYILPINRSVVTSNSQINSTSSSSLSQELYLKFWFLNDSVSKWETFGVDYKRQIRNPEYDINKENEIDEARKVAQLKNEPILLASVSGGFLAFILLLVITTN